MAESELLKYIENNRVTYIKNTQTAGSSIDAWNDATAGQALPPIEWAAGIFDDAVKTAVLPSLIKRRYDSMRRVLVPQSQVQSTTWSNTVAEDLSTSKVQKYLATTIVLDPAEYRCVMYIARKSLDEATWQLEQDVRYRLANATSVKLDTEAWTCLSTSALSSTKYQCAGESLENTTTANAVDWKPALTPDMVIDSIYAVRNTSYNFFQPNQSVVTPAMVKDLLKNSVFVSAAEWGNPSVIQSGVFSTFLGLQWHLSSNIPQDSGTTDIGAIFDDRYFLTANIPNFMEIDTWRRYWTDEIGFYVKCKAAFAVGDPDAGSILYYT